MRLVSRFFQAVTSKRKARERAIVGCGTSRDVQHTVDFVKSDAGFDGNSHCYFCVTKRRMCSLWPSEAQTQSCIPIKVGLPYRCHGNPIQQIFFARRG